MKTLKILKTKNYGIFRYILGNRDVNQKNKERLKQSIKTIGQQMPLLCVKSNYPNYIYDVIDGQHRLEAIKELKEEVDFIVSKKADKDFIPDLQVSKQWNALDYCRRNASLLHGPSVKALEKANEYFLETNKKMTLITALELLWEKSAVGVKLALKNKTYNINLKEAEAVYRCLNIIKSNTEHLNPYSTRMVRAFKMIYQKYNKINERAVDKLSKKHYLKTFASSTDMYLYVLDLYKKYNK